VVGKLHSRRCEQAPGRKVQGRDQHQQLRRENLEVR
jgi:hypothetical protein